MKFIYGAILSISLFLGCSYENPDSIYNGLSKSVTYSVTGTVSSVNIVIRNSTGGVESFQNVSLPYTKSFGVDGEAHFLYILAKNNDATGSITTAISVNGKEVGSLTNTDAYGTAAVGQNVGH